MVDIIYTFHMPAFLFISGYVYVTTRGGAESYGKFLLKKARRLLVPYIVVSLLIISIKILTEGHAYLQNPVGPEAYLRIFYLPEAGYFLWFVFALWWMFVITGPFRSRQVRLILLATATVLAIIPVKFTEILCLEQFRSMFVYFMAGAVARDYGKHLVTSLDNPKTAIAAIAIATVAEITLFGTGNPLTAITLSCCGTIGIIAFSSLLLHFSACRPLLAVSSASYVIYLLHTSFEGATKAAAVKVIGSLETLTQTHPLIFVTSAIAIVSSGIILPMLFDRWIIRRSALLRKLFGY